MDNTDHPPAVASLISRVERGDDLTEGEREMIARVMRAALDGRAVAGIVADGQRAQRDFVIAAMRSRHFASMSPSGAAKAIARYLARYAAEGWPADRRAASPPSAGSLRRAGYEVLLTGKPPAWRTVLTTLQKHPVAPANNSAAQRSEQ